MKIKFENENGQIRLPSGKQELVIEKEGYKKATVLAYIHKNGMLDIIKAKNVKIDAQKPVNILRKNGTCERMNKLKVYLERETI